MQLVLLYATATAPPTRDGSVVCTSLLQYNPDVVYDHVIPSPGPLSALVQKLNACVSQLEQFPVKVRFKMMAVLLLLYRL